MSEAVTGIESVYDKAAGLEQLCDLSASMNKSMNIFHEQIFAKQSIFQLKLFQ